MAPGTRLARPRPGDFPLCPALTEAHRLGRVEVVVALLPPSGVRDMPHVCVGGGGAGRNQVPDQNGKLACIREVYQLRPHNSCSFSSRKPSGYFSWNTLPAQPPSPKGFIRFSSWKLCLNLLLDKPPAFHPQRNYLDHLFCVLPGPSEAQINQTAVICIICIITTNTTS